MEVGVAQRKGYLDKILAQFFGMVKEGKSHLVPRTLKLIDFLID